MAPSNFICLSVCLSVCLSACLAFTAYISVTMGWILIKLGVNVGTLVQLIVLKFEHRKTDKRLTQQIKVERWKDIFARPQGHFFLPLRLTYKFKNVTFADAT